MNILQILPELNVGGVETGTVDFAKYLFEQGHKSVVISYGGALVERLESHESIHYKLPVHAKNLFTALQMIGKVRKIIIDENIDIVHARSRVPAWIAYFACKKTKATFITTCHGYYKNKWFSRIMGWSKLVIVPSRVIGRHMIDDYQVPAENIRNIPRSVDLSRFVHKKLHEKGKSQQTIAIIGRITQLKGHVYFLKAMGKVIRSFPYAKIWIIGDAPPNKQDYKRELITLIKRVGIQNNVEFLGNRQDVPELLPEIDVVVFSSIVHESFGRVIIEAQSAGVPVVASSMGGVVDIIEDGKTGLLVPPRDSDAIAKSVVRLLNDKDLVQRFAEAAQEKIKNEYTLDIMSSRTVAVYEEILGMKNILVIKLASIGDVVLVTASLRAIRKKFPMAKIHCVVGKESRKVLQGCPYVDDLIIYDRNHKDRGFWRFLCFVMRLRRCKFDKVIDFQNNKRSHFMACLSGAQETYGYRNRKCGFLLSHGIKDDEKDIPAVEHQFRVLEPLGITYRENMYLQLWPSKQDKNYVQELLDSEWLGNIKHIVGINLSASLKWSSKNWPLKSIASLCDMLAQENVRVILTGTEEDKDKSREVLKMAQSKPASFVGKTDIMQLAALIGRCRVFLSPDSAPIHVAAAMNVPSVVLFGPTDASRHIPPARKLIVLRKEEECSPCYCQSCQMEKHLCMENISCEEVFESIMSLME